MYFEGNLITRYNIHRKQIIHCSRITTTSQQMSSLSPLIELHIMQQATAYIDSLPDADRSSLNTRLHRWYRLLNSPFSSPAGSRSSSPTCPPNSPNPRNDNH